MRSLIVAFDKDFVQSRWTQGTIPQTFQGAFGNDGLEVGWVKESIIFKEFKWDSGKTRRELVGLREFVGPEISVLNVLDE